MNTLSSSDLSAKLRLLGVSQAYASQIANRVRRPSLELAVRIEAALDIPPRFWVPEVVFNDNDAGQTTRNDSANSGDAA